MFFLTFLLVLVIPLAEGALFALFLRELYIRHPLPLGGSIGPQKPSETVETVAPQETNAEIDDDEVAVEVPLDPVAAVASDSENIQGAEASNVPIAPPADSSTADAPSDGLTDEQPSALHPEVSVFDGAQNLPDHLPVGNLLESMTAEASVIISDDLENRIEASALPDGAIPEALQTTPDNANSDHLQALAEALADSLPPTNFDFSQEEMDPEQAEAASAMAKELLGENFDFNALEQQSLRSKRTVALDDGASAEDAPDSSAEMNTDTATETDSEEIALDIQEDGAGMVQVSSPFVANTVLQLSDFAAPQTIFPTFSDDWIQETNSTADESMEGEASQFCYAEELRPMFVRRKKSEGA